MIPLKARIRKFAQQSVAFGGLCLTLHPVWAAAEVTKVVITTQGIVAGGRGGGESWQSVWLLGRAVLRQMQLSSI